MFCSLAISLMLIILVPSHSIELQQVLIAEWSSGQTIKDVVR